MYCKITFQQKVTCWAWSRKSVDLIPSECQNRDAVQSNKILVANNFVLHVKKGGSDKSRPDIVIKLLVLCPCFPYSIKQNKKTKQTKNKKKIQKFYILIKALP